MVNVLNKKPPICLPMRFSIDLNHCVSVQCLDSRNPFYCQAKNCENVSINLFSLVFVPSLLQCPIILERHASKMINFDEDVIEDSAAYIVEERRFEDGQPSKIRLRYQRSKLMKQLSSTSSSSSHLHRSTNVLKHPDRDEMGETIRNNSLRNSRKSSDVISDNESPLPPPPPSPPEHPCIVNEQMQSSSQSFGGSYVVTSPLSPLPPPPPPDSTQSGLLVFLPEKHSQNPLFADSEEEGKRSDGGVTRLSLPANDGVQPHSQRASDSPIDSLPSDSTLPSPPSSPRYYSLSAKRENHRRPREKAQFERGSSRLRNQDEKPSRGKRDTHPTTNVNRRREDYRRSHSNSPPRVSHRKTTPHGNVKKSNEARTNLEALYPKTASLGAVQLLMDQNGDDPNRDLVDFICQQRQRNRMTVPLVDQGVESFVDDYDMQQPSPNATDSLPYHLRHEVNRPSPSAGHRANPAAAQSFARVPTSASAALVPLDQSSTLQSLIAENDELREKIGKLQKELKEKDMEMQSLKLDAVMREAESDSRMASRVAEVVDELYAAQKERDAALLQRMRVADRRDDAIGRRDEAGQRRRHRGLRRKGRSDEEKRREEEDYLDFNSERRLLPYHHVDDDDDKDFDVATKSLELQFRRRVEEMEKEKIQREKIAEEEIVAAVEERDLVLGRCRIMRQEIEKMKKRALEQDTFERKMTATVKERDEALAKLKILESKLEDANIEKGLYLTLSRERTLAEELNQLTHDLQNREKGIRVLSKEKEILAEELTGALEDKEEAEEKRRLAKKESLAMKENAMQLEKFVRMLQDKLESRRVADYRNARDGGRGSAGSIGRGSAGSVGSDRSRASGGSGSVGSGDFRSDSFDSGSESCGSPRGSIVSNASVTPATHL